MTVEFQTLITDEYLDALNPRPIDSGEYRFITDDAVKSGDGGDMDSEDVPIDWDASVGSRSATPWHERYKPDDLDNAHQNENGLRLLK
jgi:hypothetical protein